MKLLTTLRNFYSALRELYGPSSSGTSPLLNAEGSILLTEGAEITKHWAEHFSNVLNRPSVINDEALSRLPQVEINNTLAYAYCPTLQETQNAIDLLANRKVPGA